MTRSLHTSGRDSSPSISAKDGSPLIPMKLSRVAGGLGGDGVALTNLVEGKACAVKYAVKVKNV
jgi:hypothetical protein